MTAPVPAYVYNATVVRWVDGDTCDLSIDLGLRIYHVTRCRLLGIDAPERGHTNWAEASANAKTHAPAGSRVVVATELDRDDKYGRLLATIYVGELNINQDQIDDGLAVPYDGGHK